MSKKPQKKPKAPRQVTPQQELFCRYYTQNELLFGNATLSYAEAYDFELDSISQLRPCDDKPNHTHARECEPSPYDLAYHTCSVNGSRLLRNADIQKRVTVLLNEILSDSVVDSQLAKLIMQDAEPATKIAAIREYNKLRSRIKEQVEHSGLVVAVQIPAEKKEIAAKALSSYLHAEDSRANSG